MGLPAFVGVQGNPLPTRISDTAPAAPADPSPSADAVTVTNTGTGLIWNGYGRYAGFRVTSQDATGTITVHGGPDATFPVIHQQTSPAAETYYYATTVDEDDLDTYIEFASLYVVCSGTNQIVEYYLDDRA